MIKIIKYCSGSTFPVTFSIKNFHTARILKHAAHNCQSLKTFFFGETDKCTGVTLT